MRTAALAAAMSSLALVSTAATASAGEEASIARTIQGVASWYGNQFHGRTTANGETYNQNGLTAAHKTLAFGTKVRVTNRNNGKTVTVRINDRGPFHGGRVIDLSRGAARAVSMMGSGTAPVRVDVLGRGVAGTQQASLY